MPNDTWTENKANPWLDKTAAPLKTLKDIDSDRQLASEAPKPVEPILPPPAPLETIAYDRVASDFEKAAQDVLGAISKLSDANVRLSNITITVSNIGPKGETLIQQANRFREQVEHVCIELKDMSSAIADYKNSLSKENPPAQV